MRLCAALHVKRSTSAFDHGRAPGLTHALCALFARAAAEAMP
ncbi:hypothetical protein J155_04471 [Xanthomonas citri pv. citri]|nr:hypothetical protein J151_04518 [Xanthomonas citri subsp. citri A306]AJY84394.1 hypothetical protein J159_04467 [Xanthomonas citri pv. citri]AJY88818.1 hypothetical protein J158_04469 [Xanthomonas citri subsp. citri UI6]AJY93289.1 hypothetical protein J169_04516 [Xanthomonas citri pv. citri]AJY97713.1 hypothetical protein J164_04469 [Xanthomonas citri pv. citri]